MKVFINGESAILEDGCSIAALLDARNIGRERVAVEVNLEIVPRAKHAEHTLMDGDRVEIVQFVGGG